MSKTLEDMLNIFSNNLGILLCINFQCTLMLVDGCNFAQLTAWAYRGISVVRPYKLCTIFWNMKT